MEKEFKFDRIERGDSKNVINLFFTDRMAYHQGEYDIEVIDVSGDFLDFSKDWFLDRENYIVGTTDKKVYLRYMDGSRAIDLAGFSFEMKYKVKQRDTVDNILEGKVGISL